MKAYTEYIDRLEILSVEATALNNKDASISERINAALDGEASAEFRRLVPLEMRRQQGTFFSNSDIAKQAVNMLGIKNVNKSFVIDPACGIGNLLLSYVDNLPKGKNLSETLDIWSGKIGGIDIHPELTQTAKLRLYLKALSLYSDSGKHNFLRIEKCFSSIVKGNAYNNNLIAKASHILINPPFGYIQADKDCTWADGRISAAALFLDKTISQSKEGTVIVAILPDVLRSGQRYSEWRKYIQGKAKLDKIKILGQFDKWADVDVFLLRLVVGAKNKRAFAWIENNSLNKKQRHIKDLCDVHIGPVVPYRDIKRGTDHLYLYPQGCPPWKTVRKIKQKRKYSGPTYVPPFIVVRRTSRPGDKYRAIGTIISGSQPVAIENHLIIIQPRDKKLETCKIVLENLQNEQTTKWLDNRIRCRHLTVDSIRSLPIWE
jgi:hypothetical protein